MIAARAIIPGVASWTPHCTLFDVGPDGLFFESDEGPNSITLNICVCMSADIQEFLEQAKTRTLAKAGFRNRVSLLIDPSG